MTSHTTRRPGRHRAGGVMPGAPDRVGLRGTRHSRAVVGMAATAATVGAAFSGSPPAVAAPSTSSSATTTEESPAARAAHAEPEVPGTPCSVSARACVDLESQRAWLIDDGEVVRGPMRVTTGARGYETPIGHSFRVYRQDADHVSKESRLPDGSPSPMPYSTFFADGGVAFHGGSLARASAGCVHLSTADAKAVFDYLGTGDMVQVVNASQERKAREALA